MLFLYILKIADTFFYGYIEALIKMTYSV